MSVLSVLFPRNLSKYQLLRGLGMLQSKKYLLLSFFACAFQLFALEIEFEALAYCPHSRLSSCSEKQKIFIGQRGRFSTCTAVAWHPDNERLISADLLDSSMQIFRYERDFHSLTPLHFIPSNSGVKLSKPEHLSFSPDGTLLAVANGIKGNLNIYAISQDESMILSAPIAVLKEEYDQVKIHSVRFSKDGKFLAYVTCDAQAKVCIFRVVREGEVISFLPCQTFSNWLDPLKPKGIDFSWDGRFIAICYSSRAGRQPNSNYRAVAETYAFDQTTGRMDFEPISHIEIGLSASEDILFHRYAPYAFISNQGNDTITVHEFDERAGILRNEVHTCIGNPSAQLSFPHGISLSADGQYLAASNYGDDKVTIYKVSFTKEEERR